MNVYDRNDKLVIQNYNKKLAEIAQNSITAKAKADAMSDQWARERAERERQRQAEKARKEAEARAKKEAAEREKIRKATEEANRKMQEAAEKQAREERQAKLKEQKIQREKEKRLPALDKINNFVGDINKNGLTPMQIAGANMAQKMQGGLGNSTQTRTDFDNQVDKYLSSGKLSKADVKNAKAALKEEKNRRNQLIKSGNTDAMIKGSDEYNRLQKWNELDAKVNNQFGYGLVSPFMKMAGLAQSGIDKVTGNDKSLADEQIQNFYANDRAAAEQAPIKHGVGAFAGQAALYAGTNPLFDGAAEAAGVTSRLGKFAVNQLAQNAQDLALDTAPTYNQALQSGMSEEDARKEALKGMGLNALGNVVMGGASELMTDLLPVLKNARDARNYAKYGEQIEAAREGLRNMQAVNAEDAMKAVNPTPVKTVADNVNPADIGENAVKNAVQGAENTSITPREEMKNKSVDFLLGVVDKAWRTVEPGQTPEIEAKNMELYDAITYAMNYIIDEPTDFNMEWLKAEIRDFAKYNHLEDTITNKKIDDYLNGLKEVRARGIKAQEPEALKTLDIADEIRNRNTESGNIGLALTDHIGEIMRSKGIDFDPEDHYGMIDCLKSAIDNPTETNIGVFEHEVKDYLKANNISGEITEAEIAEIGQSLRRDNIDRLLSSLKIDVELSKDYVKTGKFTKRGVENVENFEKAYTQLADALENGTGDEVAKAYEQTRIYYNRVTDFAKRYLNDYYLWNNRYILGENEYNLMKQYKDLASRAEGLKYMGPDGEYTDLEGIDFSDITTDELIEIINEIPSYDSTQHIKALNKPAGRVGIDSLKPTDNTLAVMADADGLNARRGVDVRSDIRNTSNMDYTPSDALVSEQKISKVRRNTLENAGIDTEDELKNIIPEEDFSYFTESEKQTYEAAMSSVENDFDGNVKRYSADYDDKDIDNIRSAQDIDSMMLVRERINDMARNTDDPAERKALYETSRKIALNMRKAGTKAGQSIQAFAKWTRTPEGATAAAEGFAEDLVQKGLKKNPRMASDIVEVSKEINNFLDEMDASAATREEIEDMIRSSIRKRKMLSSRVGNGDIKRIADAIMNEKQYVDIQKQLEFLSTGFDEIDGDTMMQVQEMFEQAQGLNYGSKKRVEIENEAYKILANKLVPNGGSFRDKFDAWRYLAMLANPTTHFKNITGNMLFGKGAVTAKNTLAAMIESAADRASKAMGKGGIKRTKTILTPNDNALIKACGEDALENSYRELSGNKYYNTGDSINNAISPFNTKTAVGRFLNKASEINGGFLNKEDEVAVMAKYKTSLAGYLKANGADQSIFAATDKASKQLLEDGRAYAINQAKEAAFHQDSGVANFLAQISNSAKNSDNGFVKGAGMALDITVPFKKTPVNILKSAFEYSPLELFKVAKDVGKMQKGLMSASELIDDLSKAATGTAALGIGALLAHEGIIKIGMDKSNNEDSFDKNTGRQNVAIKQGNKYVGLSEFMPAAAPIIFGATIYETITNKKGGENALNTIISGISSIANGVTDMTMLSGIADTLQSVAYAEDDSDIIMKLGMNLGGNVASQMLPTIGRKIGITADETKRSTYSDQTGALKEIDQEAKYLQTKIPGLQQLGEQLEKSDNSTLQSIGDRFALEPNVDVKGQVQENFGGSLLGRAAYNFISPATISVDKSTAYDDERRRLVDATGDERVLPHIASKEATINDTKLSPEQWTKYRQDRGQMRETLHQAAIDSKAYKDMEDADKAELLNTLDDFSKGYSQNKYGKDMTTTQQKMAGLYDKGGAESVIDYINVKNNLPDTKDATKIDALAKLPEDKQDALLPALFDVESSEKKMEMWEKSGKDGSEFIKLYQKDAEETAKKKAENEKKKAANAKKKEAEMSKMGLTVQSAKDLQADLASYGAIDSETTVKYYTHAKQTIPNLTTREYTSMLKRIGGSDMKIAQKEMLSYFGAKNVSQEEANKLWNAYGDWKTVPVLKNGKWKAAKK